MFDKSTGCKTLHSAAILKLAAALVLVLAAFLAFEMIGSSDLSAAESGDTGSCTWSLDETGRLTISGTGAMADYAENDELPWGTSVTSVVIEDGVTSVGNYAFHLCTSLSEVTLGNSVETIGSGAFMGCSSLKSLPAGDSVKTIKGSAFRDCSSLTVIVLPDTLVNLGITSFAGCTSMTKAVIGDSVTAIGSTTFSGCTSLTSVTIGKSVKSIDISAFGSFLDYPDVYKNIREVVNYSSLSIQSGSSGCGMISNYAHFIHTPTSEHPYTEVQSDYLTASKVTIPDSVTSIGPNTFRDCTNLSEIVFGKGLAVIGGNAFNGCASLKSVTIPESVNAIKANAFLGCTSLTEATIGDSVATIPDNMFDGCTKLTGITIGKSVSYIGKDVFKGCASLESFNVDKDNTKYSSADGVLLSKDGKTLVQYPIGNSRTAYDIPDTVTTINGYAFQNCSYLTTVTIPESVTSIGNYAFFQFTSLESVTIPSSVTSIGDFSFNQCASLKSIRIPDSVTTIGTSVFYKCTSLESVTLPKSATSIGTYVFYGCTKLTSVTIPDSVTSVGNNAFYGCTALTSVTMPDSVTAIGYNAFYGCTKLASATLPGSLQTIGTYAFDNCYALESVTIPETVTSIGMYAFYNCKTIKTISIPSSVTSIGDGAFRRCLSLANIDVAEGNANYRSIDGVLFSMDGTKLIQYNIGSSRTSYSVPDSVTTIGNGSFLGCTAIVSVTVPDSVTYIGDHAFYDCSSLSSVSLCEVTSIRTFVFYGCKSLESISIPASVTSIEMSAFYLCSSLSHIDVDANNENYCSVDGVLFSKDMTTLVAYPIGNSRTTYEIPASVTSIKTGAFRACSHLASIEVAEGNSTYTSVDGVLFTDEGKYLVQYPIGNSRTSYDVPADVVTIGNYSFNKCTTLVHVTVGDSLKTIKEYAFDGCSSIRSIRFGSSFSALSTNTFNGFGFFDESEKRLTIGSDYLKGHLFHGNDYSHLVITDGHTGASPVTENVVDSTYSKEGSYDSVVYCSVCGSEISRDHMTTAKKPAAEINTADNGYTAAITEGTALSSDSLQNLVDAAKADSKKTFEVTVGTSKIVLDNKALQNIDPSKDTHVSVEKNMSITVDNAVDYVVYDISFGDNHDFKGGKLTITVPYTGSTSNLKVFYMVGGVAKETLDCTYSEGTVTFQVDHLSTFAIADVKESGSSSSGGMCGSTIAAILVSMCAVLAIPLIRYIRP